MVIIVIVVGAFIGLFSFTSQEEPNQVVAPIPTPIPTPTPTPKAEINTSNWQTYRNDEFGFEVRYPEGWIFRFVSQTFVSPVHSSFAIQNVSNESRWINILIGEEINEISPYDPISQWNIDGMPARQFSVQIIPSNIGVSPPGAEFPDFPIHPGLWIEKDGMFYAFVFYGIEEIGGIFDQILSTFRFVE